jgi:hypothetical protein
MATRSEARACAEDGAVPVLSARRAADGAMFADRGGRDEPSVLHLTPKAGESLHGPDFPRFT